MVSITIDDQLVLRAYIPEDAESLFAVIDQSRGHLHPWLPWVDSTKKLADSLEFIRQSTQQMRNQEGLALGIFYHGNIIGGIGMHEWDHAVKKAQIGYWIAKEYEGKGVMSTVLTAFIKYLFDKAGLNKIEIHFIPSNQRSARIVERIGAQIEGIIRQSIIRNGQPADVIVAGLLKSEWKNRSGK